MIGYINKKWEKERDEIEAILSEKLKEQIKKIDNSFRDGNVLEEDKAELKKLRSSLILRRALAVFEAEDIARNRMQLRASYLALALSGIALIVSVSTAILKAGA